MATLAVVDQTNKKVGTVEVSDEVFAAPINATLVHQVIKAQLAGRRRGTAKTKKKDEVRGGGRKPFKQKGTGSARQGSTRSPLQVGGGVAFGPRPRSFEQSTPKKMMQGALRSAISDRCKAGRLLIVDSLSLASPKTKTLDAIFKKGLGISKALVLDQDNKNLELSGRNIPHSKFLKTDGINVYDIIAHDWLVLSKVAALAINERLKGASE